MLSLLRPWCLLLLLAGCASALPPEPVAPPTVPEAAAEPGVPKRAVPPGQLRREDVLAVLSEGPPSLLQKIDVEPAVDGGGRFVGWRVMAVRDPALAAGEVQVGDVVRRVNGQGIERPFEFFEVFQSLAFAPTLTLSIERGTERRELSYPINDDPLAPALPRPDKATPGARPGRPTSDTGSTVAPPGASPTAGATGGSAGAATDAAADKKKAKRGKTKR